MFRKFFLCGGLGKFGVSSPGYVGKIIEENKLSKKCLQFLVSQVGKLFHEFLNVHGVLMGVCVDHTIMDCTFVGTFDGRHPTVLLCSGVNYSLPSLKQT